MVSEWHWLPEQLDDVDISQYLPKVEAGNAGND